MAKAEGKGGVIPRTPEEMERECLGVIARAAADVERTAMNGDVAGVNVHFNFLKLQIERLYTIRHTIRRNSARP